MRFSVFIAACAIFLASEGALRFARPSYKSDLGIAIAIPQGAKGEPLDLPRAESYLVTRGGESYLEDRFDSFDLWRLRTMRARWCDADGNRLYVARLDSLPPEDPPGTVRTRVSFEKLIESEEFDPRNAEHRDTAAVCIAPVELGRAVRPRRAMRKNFTDLVAYTVTNENVLAYAFRPKDPDKQTSGAWYLAVLVAEEGADMAEVRETFDRDFLDEISIPRMAPDKEKGATRGKRADTAVGENTGMLSALAATRGNRADTAIGENTGMLSARAATRGNREPLEAELLLRDVRRQVANYDEWNLADSEDVILLDNLPGGVRRQFVTALTNYLPKLRREYALRAPSALSGTNALAVVRAFATREEYLAYVGVDKKWTAAVWSPVRRELVMYYPEEGLEKLLSTVWHEAFHQYLAYAGAMVQSSPWFNEGHAQLFENVRIDSKGRMTFAANEQAAQYVHEYAAQLAEVLPELFKADYTEFYAGECEEVAAKYRIAWSIAYFLEVGAPKLRFRPYETLRADYVKALVKTRSMHEATAAVFGDEKSRDEFVAAWLAFWREQ